MWKKILSLNLAVLMVLTMVPVSTVHAVRGSDYGYAFFHKNDGTEETVLDTEDLYDSWLPLYTVAPYISGENKVVTSYNTKALGTGKSYKLSSPIGECYSTIEEAPTDLYAQWEEAPGNYIFYVSGDGLTSDGKD
ncbi:hypothetical protein [uncultured Mailhella sp.]|uniref:hypothetical protein n=1 Tax=uncultured Mailhella sp. TaxID=1981031 RepID=UPI00262903F2|nr:hypothetical protein [uncultured Mailhella sp.]